MGFREMTIRVPCPPGPFFSMMGLYPVSPADPVYSLTVPIFDKVTLHLDNNYYNNDKIILSKEGNERVLEEIRSDGKTVKGFFITHRELVGSKELKFKTKAE